MYAQGTNEIITLPRKSAAKSQNNEAVLRTSAGRLDTYEHEAPTTSAKLTPPRAPRRASPLHHQLLSRRTAALSLSCKCLLYTLSPPLSSLQHPQRESLLLHLERDSGASHFYCPYCSALHGFLSLPGCDGGRYIYRRDSCLRNQFPPYFMPFEVAYYHGRLIMNRHFYGGASGLPLESLIMAVVGVGMNHRRSRQKWVTETTGAIIQDELVLYVKHTLESTDLGTLWTEVATRGY